MRIFLIIIFFAFFAGSVSAELILLQEDIVVLQEKAKNGRKDAQQILDRYFEQEAASAADDNLALSKVVLTIRQSVG